jgi:glycosyltransferase involved in cell wall biosynthesis
VRVAHLTTVDSSLWYLLRPQLLAVNRAGGQAFGVSADGPWVARLEADGVRHLALRSSTRGWSLTADVKAAAQLWRILRRERFDVLHTHNPKPGLYGRVVGRLAGVPIVVNTNHGLYFADGVGPKKALVLALEGVAALFSDAELVQNEEDLAVLRRWHLNRRRQSWLLGNGVDLRRFRPAGNSTERIAARAELGAEVDQVVVGVVGRLVAEKGFPELFEAARSLGDRYLIAAIGPADPDKSDALPPAQIEGAKRAGVRFFGLRDDVDQLYRGMDLFVLPSQREGFPRAAMEAAASGLAVVATDVRGCRQVVEDGVTGLLVPVRDPGRLAAAIKHLGTDPAVRSAMGAAAALRAREHFDEERVVRMVLDTYQAVAVRKKLGRLIRWSGRSATD